MCIISIVCHSQFVISVLRGKSLIYCLVREGIIATPQTVIKTQNVIKHFAFVKTISGVLYHNL